MRMARADGRLIKGGGRVVKNVSGYDLPKLFCGSLGTLGAIVEVTFKLRPLPTSDQLAILTAADFTAALTAAQAAARTEPSLQAAVALSAASAGELAGGQAAVALRMSGLEQAVVETLTRASEAAHNAGASGGMPSDAGVIETWQEILDLELATPADHMRLRLGAPPTALPDARALLSRVFPNAERWIAAADSGLLFIETPLDDPSRAAGQIAEARAGLGPLGGNLTLELAPPELKQQVDIWGPAGEGARLMRKIKDEFDPRRTLNPGRFVDGI